MPAYYIITTEEHQILGGGQCPLWSPLGAAPVLHHSIRPVDNTVGNPLRVQNRGSEPVSEFLRTGKSRH